VIVSCSAKWGIPISTISDDRLKSHPELKLPSPSRIPRSIALAAALVLAAVIKAPPSRAASYGANASTKRASQGLWVVEEGSFAEFQGTSLKNGGKPNPALHLAVAGPAIADIVFDKVGNLWIGFLAETGVEQISELTRNELLSSKKFKLFHVTISYPHDGGEPLDDLSSLAFDPAGDLWAAVPTTGNLIEYTPDQLVASGTPTPAATLHFTDGPSTTPAVIRFDSAGNLWLAYPGVYSSPWASAVEFTAAQVIEIQMGGSPVPSLVVEALGSDLVAVSAIAFDANANLWIAGVTYGIDPNGVDGGSVQMFDVTGKSGTLSQPDVTISPSAISSINQSLDAPSGLAFDQKGNLWIANSKSSDQVSGGANSTGFIVKFAAGQLTASGSPVPPTVISPNQKGSNLKYPGRVVFGPTVK
jgi:hypothetical protein